jgi:hypothetical protein
MTPGSGLTVNAAVLPDPGDTLQPAALVIELMVTVHPPVAPITPVINEPLEPDIANVAVLPNAVFAPVIL